MVQDAQVLLLRRLVLKKGEPIATAAAKAGMCETTARKYVQLGKLPSETKKPHTWRTRKDPFAAVWEEVEAFLKVNPNLEVKALFGELQRRHPGTFQPGQLRTLQRRVKQWRATEGPAKEVFFAQEYEPGDRAQSDFTCMNGLGVTIRGAPLPHLLYHFVLPYSNWETGTVCRSESFEALSEGLQQALHACGGVPRLHQTDSLSAAVRKLQRGGGEAFTDRYQALMRHCGMEARHTQVRSPHENGKVEQRHYRLKLAMKNQLILRGSNDFESRQAYEAFLKQLFAQLNAPRKERLKQERAFLGPLPERRLESYKAMRVRVSKGSTIRVRNNSYSVPSRLIGEQVDIRLFGEAVEVRFGQRLMERMPRLHGRSKHRIEYRHVIDSLVRKPGAFAHYRYRADLFPTHRFRMAYDALRRAHKAPLKADKAYLRVLHLAAKESESGVDAALSVLLKGKEAITAEAVEALLDRTLQVPDYLVAPPVVDLSTYDGLLEPSTTASLTTTAVR